MRAALNTRNRRTRYTSLLGKLRLRSTTRVACSADVVANIARVHVADRRIFVAGVFISIITHWRLQSLGYHDEVAAALKLHEHYRCVMLVCRAQSSNLLIFTR